MTFTNRVIQVYRHFFSSYRADLSVNFTLNTDDSSEEVQEQKDIFVIIVIFLIGFIFSGFAALSIEVIEVNGIFVLQKSVNFSIDLVSRPFSVCTPDISSMCAHISFLSSPTPFHLLFQK